MSGKTWWTIAIMAGLVGASACSAVAPTGPAPPVGPEVQTEDGYSVLAKTSSPQSQQTRVAPKPQPAANRPDRGGSWSPGGSYTPRDNKPNRPDRQRGGSWTPPRDQWTPGPRPTSKPSWRPSHRPSHRWDRDRHRNHWRTRYKYKSGSIYYFPYGRDYFPYYYDNDDYYPYVFGNYPSLYYDNGSYYPYGSQGPLTSDAGTAVEDATVVIYENRFMPERVLLKPGGTIKWVNMDRVDHTATPDIAQNFAATGEIGPGATSAPLTISAHGEIRYHCEFHPDMRGTIIVE